MYPRTQYLNQLIAKKDNQRVKIITGLRRSGKSVLLFKLYRDWLLDHGVAPEQIIAIALDGLDATQYRNPIELDQYIRHKIVDSKTQYYLFIDDIPFVQEIPNPYIPNGEAKITFVDLILGLMKLENVDIYVTGSQSKMLSSDIPTQFRDRGDEIRVYPLSYAEFYNAYSGDKRSAWQLYYTYGGMPFAVSQPTLEEKSRYLKDLFVQTYIQDILERHHIQNDTSVLVTLLAKLASSIGSLTNPTRLAHMFKNEQHITIALDTVNKYIEYFEDSFLISKALRYDIKRKKYISTPAKYYFTDIGLRNAKLNFRQIEENHIIENVLYNDLIRRGFDVDVGVIDYFTRNEAGKTIRKSLDVDFVVHSSTKRFYIQSALTISDPEKKAQAIEPLKRIPDSFSKIVVVNDYLTPWTDDSGITYIGIENFLLDESFLR